jgi:putative membrane protein
LDVLSALVQDRAWEWRWDMHPMWWMWGAGGIVMMVMMLAFWGVLIGGIVLAIRWMTRLGHTPVRDPALEILRERYARGEISREEFETRRRDLLG